MVIRGDRLRERACRETYIEGRFLKKEVETESETNLLQPVKPDLHLLRDPTELRRARRGPSSPAWPDFGAEHRIAALAPV